LNVLASHLGLTFKHHNAAEDAAICAETTISIARSLGAQVLSEVPAMIGMKPGRLFAGGYEPCTCRKR
jgi:DNA polymerase-3 subunit epsilon